MTERIIITDLRENSVDTEINFFPGAQTDFLNSKATELLWLDVPRTGKKTGLFWDAMGLTKEKVHIANGDYRALLVFNTIQQLQDCMNTMNNCFKIFNAKYKHATKTFIFPSGAVIDLYTNDRYSDLLMCECNYIGFLAPYREDIYMKLMIRAKDTPDKTIKAKVRMIQRFQNDHVIAPWALKRFDIVPHNINNKLFSNENF